MSQFKDVGGVFASLADACAAVGVEPPPGWTIHQCREFTPARCIGDKGKRKAATVARIRAKGITPGASVMNWHSHEKALYLELPPEEEREHLTPEERRERERKARRLAARAIADFEKIKRQHQEAAAGVAAQIVAAASPGSSASPHRYLADKGVSEAAADVLVISHREASAILASVSSPTGDAAQRIPGFGRLLVVPLGAGGEVRTVQFITEDGTKCLLSNGRKSGSYWLPPLPGEPLLLGVAEGLATALAVRLLFGVPCAMAVDAGNLLPAAQSILADHPDARLAFFADNDPEKDYGGEKVNRGNHDALEAARSLPTARLYRSARYPGGVITPTFSGRDRTLFAALTGNQEKPPKDFNDALVLRECKREAAGVTTTPTA